MLTERGLRLLLTTDAVGGVWTHALALASGLSERGVETTLAVLGPAPTAGQTEAAAAIPGLALVDTALPLDWMAASAGEIELAAERLAALAYAADVHLVHLHSGAYACGPFLAPVVASCHSCLATWWGAMREGPMPEDFAWRSEAMRRGLLAADRLVAPTAAFGRATQSGYALPRPPEVVPNGIALPPPPESFSGPALAFAAGRLWDEAKDVLTLDRAAALTDVAIEAAGPLAGPNGASVALRHLRAVGPLTGDEVAERLALRPIFVSTARYEPFGLTALEAAAAGCALVLSDIPTLRELWEGAALFVAAGDAAGFAAAIDHLAASPSVRARRGALARERAERYGRDAMADGMMSLYRDLVGRPRRGSQPGAAA